MNTNADSNATAALDVLLSRQSHWPLTEPGRADTELDLIIDAALRAPDHGNLRPWRFVTIRGDARGPLGDLLVNLAWIAALRARASSAGTSACRETRIRPHRFALIRATAQTSDAHAASSPIRRTRPALACDAASINPAGATHWTVSIQEQPCTFALITAAVPN